MFISKLLEKIKLLNLYSFAIKFNSGVLNLQVKAMLFRFSTSTSGLLHVPVTSHSSGFSQCVFKTGVCRTDGFYCSFVGFNQMILSVSSESRSVNQHFMSG